ncbi:ABC transporter transmembrane domain-containing protein [Devosia sp. ZB163]|uniref:ABC transporter ATP-binding protein n=1 Tax=Devosia sp. ZB163 TaxID=3025938 RepID=UPI0023604792|nr:ABC transporter transmembrane domain-containing protein [Devosia sp. ZB163]MDC9825056.1 ABC transporter transmembrane domain-containing protein [Devosia sp. ZB163]
MPSKDPAVPTDKFGPKQSRDLRPIQRLAPFVFKYPWRLGLTIGFLLVSAISSLVIPSLAGKIIDKGFIEKNLDMVAQYGMLAIGVALVMALASAGRFYFISILGERVLTDLRRKVFEHLLTLDSRFFDLHRVGELTSRLNGDVATIRGAIGSSLSMMLRGVVTLVGAVILMFLTSPYLALTIVIIGPAILVPVLLYARRLRRMSRRTQDALADMSALATEALGASKTIKSFVQEPEQSRVYGEKAEMSFEAEVSRLGTRAALLGGLLFLSTTGLVVLVWWGANAVFQGTVTVGELAQFMIYALMASNALTNLSEIMGLLHTVSGATERLVEILDTEPAIKSPANPVPLPEPPLGTVEFDEVDFSYGTRDDEPVIDKVSFSIAHGETVALVGASGAGKSTIFALVQRFYDVTGGRVLVDGLDVRDVEPAQLRRRFAYVEQEPTIFAGTIADNIRFGRPEATFAEIEAAAKAALVHDFVVDLSRGYDSIVGERGVMLSGGQKQRLAIARALLKDAPILLLDEATSALDAGSERLVQMALDRLMEGRTTLVIAHRLATIRDANRILVLEKGRVIDQGTHEQLVRKGGKYAELAKLQFRDEILPAVAE